jgi:DNA-binding NarL/FixJ family response regulator
MASIARSSPRTRGAAPVAPRAAGARVGVALLDPDPVTRAGLRAIATGNDALQVLAELDDADAALRTLPDARPRVIVMEAGVAADNEGAAVKAILAAAPDVKIIAFGLGTREEELFRVFDAGASGYLIRTTLASDLGPAIKRVEAGKRYIPAEVQRRLHDRQGRLALTPREKDVLALLAKARSNATISAVLNISLGTVKLHVRAILAKLGAEDRAEAAVIAFQRGFVRAT